MDDHGDLIVYPLLSEYIPDENQLDSLAAIETITMIGYPNGIWDRANNIPVLRQGITASHAKLNYNHKRELLIDCAFYPGSSGSPIVIFNNGAHTTKEGHLNMNGRLILLRVLYAGPTYNAQGKVELVPISTPLKATTDLSMNLGSVIKSERINDLNLLI